MSAASAPSRVRLWERGGWWTATIDGKTAPIVRPVPGNAHPATAAQWRTQEDAAAELPKLLGWSVEVVAVHAGGAS